MSHTNCSRRFKFVFVVKIYLFNFFFILFIFFLFFNINNFSLEPIKHMLALNPKFPCIFYRCVIKLCMNKFNKIYNLMWFHNKKKKILHGSLRVYCCGKCFVSFAEKKKRVQTIVACYQLYTQHSFTFSIPMQKQATQK